MNLVTNYSDDENKKSLLRNLVLVVISGLFGMYLFLLNPWLVSDLHSDSYSWFLEFSTTIFQPQSAYYAESILLPLIAKLLGVTKSLEAYKILCGMFTLSILPLTAIFAQRFFQNRYKTLIFIVLFGFCFQYLQYYILGYPDPLTILLLVLAVFQKRLILMFGLLVLAMLSHFSMAALSSIGLLGMLYFSTISNNSLAKKSALVVIAAILSGKALLLAWYSVFHYRLVSRLDWALDKGYPFFLERYEANISGFWLTPGIAFLILYFCATIYFLVQTRYVFLC